MTYIARKLHFFRCVTEEADTYTCFYLFLTFQSIKIDRMGLKLADIHIPI